MGLLSATMALSLVACGGGASVATDGDGTAASAGKSAGEERGATGAVAGQGESTGQGTTASDATATEVTATDMFTERDLRQAADTSNAKTIDLADGQDVQVTEDGTYVIRGTAKDASVIVDAPDDAKVQIVLDSVSITNTDSPAIYVKNADKTFVTTAENTENAVKVTGTFVADGETNTDGVIFAKDDLTLNGLGKLVVESTDNGVVCKNDLRITGGTYEIDATGHAVQAQDSVAIADGTLSVTAGTDGIHAKDGDDDTKGLVYIGGGSLSISAGSDGIQATTSLQVDGGTLNITASEGMEATQVRINGGSIGINASDDGINATTKSASVGTPSIEINDGKLTLSIGQGDTDALDTNGDLTINGGTVDITAQSAFDCDGKASLTGGTVTVNGEQVSEIANSMMGGGGRGGMMGGDMGHRQMRVSEDGGMAPGGQVAPTE